MIITGRCVNNDVLLLKVTFANMNTERFSLRGLPALAETASAKNKFAITFGQHLFVYARAVEKFTKVDDNINFLSLASRVH